MNLNTEDINKLKYDKNNKVKVKHVNLSTGDFYAKYCYDDEIFKELLAKKVFDIVGIKCPKYHMVEEIKCVLSEDLNEYKNFYTMSELEKNIISNIISINDLKEFFKSEADKYNRFKNFDELMFKINMMHFIDILFSNCDRHPANYGFNINEDGTCDLVVFDNGEFLALFDKATRPVSFPSNDPMSYVFYSKEAEFKYFIKYADDNVIEMIKIILSKFNINTVRLLMKEIEKDTNYKFDCKRKLFLSYTKNYLLMYKIFLSNVIKRKKYTKTK